MTRNRNDSKTRLTRWERYLDMASEAGAIAMNLRDKPTRLDWLGVGVRIIGLAVRIRGEHREATANDPWSYFDDDSLGAAWVEISEEFRKQIMEHVTDGRVVDDYWDGSTDGTRVCLGSVGSERIGWLEEGRDQVVDGPYLLAERQDETLRALGERIWKRLGARHAVYAQGGLAGDPFVDEALVPSDQIRELAGRVDRFLQADVARSYLLVGPPGTGKSVGIRYIARTLGLASLRIDLGVLARHHYASSNLAVSLETLLKLLRPEAMILDDIDRVPVDGELLHFLELAARTCRVVLASANCPDKMMGAALRPGRFDELIRVDRLDPRVLRGLLGAHVDLVDRLDQLPIAYAAEFVKRCRVLGRDRALAELDELVNRMSRISGASDE